MTDHRKLPRRRHSKELKAQILAECAQPGVSVASIALSHGINANVVHKWRRQASGTIEYVSMPGFVPLALPAPESATAADIRIELRHGAMRITVTWPAAAASQCAAWMRELLK